MTLRQALYAAKPMERPAHLAGTRLAEAVDGDTFYTALFKPGHLRVSGHQRSANERLPIRYPEHAIPEGLDWQPGQRLCIAWLEGAPGKTDASET